MNHRRLALILLAPAVVLVAFTTVYPMVSSFWTSFHILNLARSLDLGRFVGLENYEEAFRHDPEFWTVMRVTAVFVVIDVGLTILAALGLAILLLRAGFGQTVLRTLIILPFAMSPALIGISWRFMFNPEYGAFARTIGAVFPFMRNVDYFASPTLYGRADLVGRLALGTLLHLHADGGPRLHPARDPGSGAHRRRQQLARVP
jgi:multiple sugar transport system permease protein